MRILIFLFFLFAIAALFPILQDKEVKIRNKVFAVISFLTLLVLAYVYTQDMKKEASSHQHIVIAYHQGKTLMCNTEEVNNQTYRYTSGTESFTSKTIQGLTVSVDECHIK